MLRKLAVIIVSESIRNIHRDEEMLKLFLCFTYIYYHRA